MPEVAWIACFWGAASAVSLPIGAVLGLWLKPSTKITSSMMAFGGGALLFALTIELFGHALHAASDGHGHIEKPGIVIATMMAAVIGGLLFNGLNRALESKGGFLRKGALIRKKVARERRAEARRLLRSLSRTKYFRKLPAEEVIRLLPHMESVAFEAGNAIFSEGDEGEYLYVIDRGKVAITRGSDEIAELVPGSIFGEMALITEQTRNATVTAREALRVWRLHRNDFRRGTESSPRLRDTFFRVVKQRTRELHDRGYVSDEEAGKWEGSAIRHFDMESPAQVDPALENVQHQKHGNPAMAIWLGMALDGIPESLVIGMLVLIAATEGVSLSLAFIVGVFLANLPEAMSSAVTMKSGGMKVARIFWMWFSLTLLTAVGAMLGALLLPAHPVGWHVYGVFGIEGLAGGAMLTMITQTMLPEAFERGGGAVVGLSTLAGFLAAMSVKML